MRLNFNWLLVNKLINFLSFSRFLPYINNILWKSHSFGFFITWSLFILFSINIIRHLYWWIIFEFRPIFLKNYRIHHIKFIEVVGIVLLMLQDFISKIVLWLSSTFLYILLLTTQLVRKLLLLLWGILFTLVGIRCIILKVNYGADSAWFFTEFRCLLHYILMFRSFWGRI